jgi:hypothetical protein
VARETQNRVGDVQWDRADRLVEVSRDVAAVREVLRGAEERTLAEIAAVLAEAAESVARAVEVAREAQPGAWMDSKQAAAYLAGRTEDSFEKIVAKTDIPKHRLTERVILYNRAELDAWLMGR